MDDKSEPKPIQNQSKTNLKPIRDRSETEKNSLVKTK